TASTAWPPACCSRPCSNGNGGVACREGRGGCGVVEGTAARTGTTREPLRGGDEGGTGVALSRGSRWFLSFVVLVFAAGLAAVWWLDAEVFDDGVEDGVAVEYTVERGQSLRSVGDDL